jgi:hypothetical protein
MAEQDRSGRKDQDQQNTPRDDSVGPRYNDAAGQPIYQGRSPEFVNNHAYQFGRELAGEDRYRDREWDDIEGEIRSNWDTRYPSQRFDLALEDILRGWSDGLVGPDPEYMDDGPTPGEMSGRSDQGAQVTLGLSDLSMDEDEDIGLDDLTGDSAFGDLGDTVRIVSSEEMAGKIDMHYVMDMDDIADLPTIDDEGNRGDDVAHLS